MRARSGSAPPGSLASAVATSWSTAVGSLSFDSRDGGSGFLVADLVGDRLHVAAERLLAGQQLVEHDAGAEEIGARIDVAGPGIARATCTIGVPISMPAIVRFGAVDARDAEVGDLQHALRS